MNISKMNIDMNELNIYQKQRLEEAANLHQQMMNAQYQIRKGEIDDVESIVELLETRVKEKEMLNNIFNYQRILQLIEQSSLSIVVIDNSTNKIIGFCILNSHPSISTGMVDFMHSNHWQYWFDKLFDIPSQVEITSYNTLWMNYFYIDLESVYNQEFLEQEAEAMAQYNIEVDIQQNIQELRRMLFQHIYGAVNELEFILLFLRDRDQSLEQMDYIGLDINQFFGEISRNKQASIENVRGIESSSGMFVMYRENVCDNLVIRMAKEEDHDDLAHIFNQQSEVLTQQFGEFFIADLIANQNLTRQYNNGQPAQMNRQMTLDVLRNKNSQGKALVAQVKNKAIGLISISKDIDYQLMSQNFKLQNYDYLLKNDFVEAVQIKKQRIREDRQIAKQEELKDLQRQLEEKRMECMMAGQRICLQQYCIEKEIDIKTQLEGIIGNDEKYKTVQKDTVDKMIDSWVKDFHYNKPTQLFRDGDDDHLDIMTIIQTERNFFIETLTYYGLPKNYMQGEGHWSDWAQKVAEEKKQQQLKKPLKKNIKGIKKKTKEEIKKEEDELKPPNHFDLQPLLNAFRKFSAANAENRAQFIQELENNHRQLLSLFTTPNGEMNESRCVDLNTMGEQLQQLELNIPQSISENLSNILECMAYAQPETKIIQVIPKREEDNSKNKQSGNKDVLKKLAEMNEPSKPIDVVQKMISYKEFMHSIYTLKQFDLFMNRLKHTKSNSYSQQNQVIAQQIEETQQAAKLKLQKERENYGSNNQYWKEINENTDNIDNFDDEQLEEWWPSIPESAQNAIVINLFCIDEKYETRSQELLNYAFQLYPDRDYIILTQPHTIPESTLLQSFSLVGQKRKANFDHVLYLIHRDSLLTRQLEIRRSQLSDLNQLLPYLNTLNNFKQIETDLYQSITMNASKMIAFTVKANHLPVGVLIISKNVNLDYYSSHFNIQDHIILKEHPKELHSRLIHCVINPVFQRSSRFILREVMRLANKTCLYFETHNKTLVPEIFNEFSLVRARTFPHFLKQKWDFEQIEELQVKSDMQDILDGHRDPVDQEEPPFALSIISIRELTFKKTLNNTRIIVVGASDTGLSFIESLLTLKEVRFTNLTLLAPGGLLTMNVQDDNMLLKHMSTNYSFEELRNLMLDARITILDAKMMTLNKKDRMIGLDKNCKLPFDVLISTVGLIDTELQNLNLLSTGVYRNSKFNGYKDKNCIQGVYSIDDPYLYKEFLKNGKKDSNMELLTRKKKPYHIGIYGRTLNTFCLINGLINRGVDPKRIHLIIPPRKHDLKEAHELETNQERQQYAEQRIEDPEPFIDQFVEEKIFKNINQLGVNVHNEFILGEIEQDSKGFMTNIIIRKEDAVLQQQQMAMHKDNNESKERQSVNQITLNSQLNSNSNKDLESQSNLENEESDEIKLNTQFLITSGNVDIDLEIFNIIHENGLVYNGRLIVQNNFQTTEPVIFACGKTCEFSFRYKNQAIGQSLRLDKYNGRELGQKLAQNVLESLDLGYLTNYPVPSNDDELPKFYMAQGQTAVLPLNLKYVQIEKQDIYLPKQIQQHANKVNEIHSLAEKDEKYIKLGFDLNGICKKVVYLGYKDINVAALSSLIGLHQKFLNKLPERFDSKLIPDICEFLSENWAMGLFHEWFSEFRHITKNDLLQIPEVQQVMIECQEHAREGSMFNKLLEGLLNEEYLQKVKKTVGESVIQRIKNGTLDFLKENQNHLMMIQYIPTK